MNSIDIDLKEFEEAMAKVKEMAEKLLSQVVEISGLREYDEYEDKELYADYYIVKRPENCKTTAKLFKLYSRWTCY